jgi:hypothetical protein
MSSEAKGPRPLSVRIVTWSVQLLGITFASIIVTVLATSLWWRLTPERHLDILVYDQTVPNDSFPQHAVLDQLFDYHRVPYDPAVDYYGSDPGGLGTHGVWPETQPDLIILADSYGVYLDDRGDVDEIEGYRVTSALSLSEVQDISRWVANGTPAYAEFAVVADPTPGEAGVVLEEIFGFRSTGWALH